jgi:hypothetical protein
MSPPCGTRTKSDLIHWIVPFQSSSIPRDKNVLATVLLLTAHGGIAMMPNSASTPIDQLLGNDRSALKLLNIVENGRSVKRFLDQASKPPNEDGFAALCGLEMGLRIGRGLFETNKKDVVDYFLIQEDHIALRERQLQRDKENLVSEKKTQFDIVQSVEGEVLKPISMVYSEATIIRDGKRSDKLTFDALCRLIDFQKIDMLTAISIDSINISMFLTNWRAITALR